ncbi:cytochrome P450 [Coprinopsis marcescibilis]|uniref:Cytochrome P450 n=1 Tax=Coprinopsis marcescibilis TaxID=230819 RepID=A0A5C3KYT3_COPMA|nr:cytochrome P450 [Coprinopsis marcescibilis]
MISHSTGIVGAVAAASLSALWLIRRLSRRKPQLPLPPSPKGLPLLGNLLDIPDTAPWEKFHQWAMSLVNILYLNVAGKNIVVLDMAEVASDLIEKRSSLYSGRMPMGNELVGWNFGFQDYGTFWFLDDPDNMPEENIRYMAAEISISALYRLEMEQKDDFYITSAAQGIAPSAELLNWITGITFRQKAQEAGDAVRKVLEVLYRASKAIYDEGAASMVSFTSLSLKNMEDKRPGDVYTEDDIKKCADALFSAGTDIKELDSIVKPGQLPDFDSQQSLLYISAIVNETLRWRNIVPQVEDEYRGYRLLAQSIIIPNAWVMLHNEDVYPRPFDFNPDLNSKPEGLYR